MTHNDCSQRWRRRRERSNSRPADVGHGTGALTGLNADQARLVRQLIDSVLPGARVAVFGSRATGRMRPCSDLDLLFIDPPGLSWAQRADLRDAFEASVLPFSVDIVEASGLAGGMAPRVLAEAQLLP